MDSRHSAAGLIGRVARGAVAGLIAAVATSLFEATCRRAHLPPADARAGPPPTELLATKVYHAVTGRSLSDVGVSVAGKVVHLAPLGPWRSWRC